MFLTESNLRGAYLITLDAAEDKRGCFARTYCRMEFAEHGLHTDYVQSSISVNRLARTLRGMHFQAAPAAEIKIVQCVRGSIYDVIIDLRPGSDTYCQWAGYELTAGNNRILYIPAGFAHGFMTGADDSAVYYMISECYAPQFAGGVRWDDPVFGINWPSGDPIISDKDRSWPDYVR